MSNQPTVLYPDRAKGETKTHPTTGESARFEAAPSPEVASLLPEDHLLKLREGTDYLGGILLLLNEHLQHANSDQRNADSLGAVTEHAVERLRAMRVHVNALTDDYLQRMREGRT
jgi:hypothetical protein